MERSSTGESIPNNKARVAKNKEALLKLRIY